MASNAQKLSAAAQFIKDAPPGEMQRVLDGTESDLEILKAILIQQTSTQSWKRTRTANSDRRWSNTIQSN